MGKRNNYSANKRRKQLQKQDKKEEKKRKKEERSPEDEAALINEYLGIAPEEPDEDEETDTQENLVDED